MGFDIVPEEYSRFKPQHRRVFFTASVPATVIATSPGSFTKLIPIHYRYAGSAAAAITMFNGSGGASIWTGNAVVAGAEQWGPLWDLTATTGGNSIEWSAGTGIGNGYFELWWIALPDTGGLTQ
jgi:hypothetical protein